MVLFIAAICICTARRLSNNFPTFGMAFSVPSRWRVRNSLMQIELLAVKGPKFGTTCRTEHPASDHRVLATTFTGKAFTRAIESFVNRFLMHSPAATKAVPLVPMPPRRRREATSPQRCRGEKRLSRAAVPLILELPLRHRCRLPSGGPQHQKSPHHQARDTLQGDEGA